MGERYFNDEAIIEGIKKGRESALKELVNRYRPQMLIEAYIIVKNKEDAEDVIQNVFMHFWLRRQKIDYQTTLGAYLLRATRNESLNSIAKAEVRQKRQLRYSYLQDTCLNIDPAQNRELGNLLMEAIETLPPATRRALKMLYLENKPHRVISAEERISTQGVKNNISRGLKILRQKLSFLK